MINAIKKAHRYSLRRRTETMTTIESPEDHPELGGWALAAGDDAQASEVEAHLRECAICAAEAPRLRSAAMLLGAATPEPPPAGLRPRVLAAALARRPSRQRLIEPYARQVAALGDLLSELDGTQLGVPESHYGTVDGVLAHLAGNDLLVVEDLELAGAGPAKGWHGQAVRLLRGVEASARLDQPVRMAGKAQLRRPLRDAIVQRTFE